MNGSRYDLLGKLQTHKRPVSDLAWNLSDPQIIGTCSADGYIFLWDLRDMKKPTRFFKTFTGNVTIKKFLRKLIFCGSSFTYQME